MRVVLATLVALALLVPLASDAGAIQLQRQRNVEEMGVTLMLDAGGVVATAASYEASLDISQSVVNWNRGGGDDIATFFMACPVAGAAPGCEVVQGIWEDETGFRWFSFAADGETCVRGTVAWQLLNGATAGCMGDPGDLVKGGYTNVALNEFTASRPIWDSNVSDVTGNLTVVAQFFGGGTTIRIPQENVDVGWMNALGAYPNHLPRALQATPLYYNGGYFYWPDSSSTSHNNAWMTSTDNLPGLCYNPPATPSGWFTFYAYVGSPGTGWWATIPVTPPPLGMTAFCSAYGLW